MPRPKVDDAVEKSLQSELSTHTTVHRAPNGRRSITHAWTKLMKAIAYHRYGGPEVLELVDLPKPVPQGNEVLIRIKTTSSSTSGPP